MKTRKQKGGLGYGWLGLKSIVLGLSTIYTENNYVLVSLMTFMNSLLRDKYNFFDDVVAVGYIFLFAYAFYNNNGTQPLYVNPLVIKLKRLMIEPSIKEHASKLYARVVLLGVDILCLHEEKYVLTILLDVFIHGLTEMSLGEKGNTSVLHSNASVQSRAEAAWISMRGRYMDILQKVRPGSPFVQVLGNIGTNLFTPEMPSMLRTLFVQTNWPWTYKYFLVENMGTALESLRWIEHALTTTLPLDKLHPFLRQIIQEGFVELPDFGPSIDIPFMIWLCLRNILSTPLKADTFLHLLNEHDINPNEFKTLLKHVNVVHAKLYVTEISIMNIACRSPITFLYENGSKLISYFRRPRYGGNPTSTRELQTLGNAFTNYSKIADLYSAEVHVNVELHLNALNSLLHEKEFPKEAVETMKTFHEEIVNFTPDKEVEAITEKVTEELEGEFIFEGDTYYDAKGGKTRQKTKQKTRQKTRQKGGDFGVLALTTTLISMYGVTANGFPAFYNVLSFFSDTKGNQNVFEGTGNLLASIVTGLYRYYNQKTLSSFVRGNSVTTAVTGISLPHIKSDFIDFYKYGLLLSIDTLFLHEKKETIYSDMVITDGVVTVEGPNQFDSRNNLICPLLDLWIFLLENVTDGLGPITETNTEFSVESRAQRTWVQALAMYQRQLRQMDTEKNYGIVFDFLKVWFTEMPEIIKRMLEKSILYFKNGLINITWKDLNGNVIISTSVANYNKNILYLKNIRTLLVSNTTVRLDHLYFMVRNILEEENVLDFPTIDGALSFNYISWLMFQNILSKPATLIKLIQERPDVTGHVNKEEVAELFKNVSGLYYGLYVTSWTEFGVNSTYQAAVKATSTFVSLPSRLRGMFKGGEGEFFDPENVDEQRSRFIQESLSIIMAKIEFMNIIHTTITGKDGTSGINKYKPEMTQLVLDFSTRVESQEEPINLITEDILEKLEEINNRIVHE